MPQPGQPFPPRPMPQGGQTGGPRPKQKKPVPQKRSGGGLLRGLFYLFLFALICVGAGAAYLLFNPPSDLIRETMVKQVKAKTGRDLVVNGPASFAFYPNLGVSLADVSLSGPAGSQTPLVKMDALTVSLKPMPLLQREVAVDTLILTKPVFDLRVDKAGKKNWDFADASPYQKFADARTSLADAAFDVAQAAPPAQSPPQNPSLPRKLTDIQNLQLGDVQIINGAIRYTDERSGATQAVDAVNAKVALPSLDSPLDANGSLAWKGETINFGGVLTNARTALQQKPAKLAFNAKSSKFDANFNGFTLIKDGVDIEGDVKANVPSARTMAAWLGTTLPPVEGFGPVSASGTMKTAGNTTSFSNATFNIDGAIAMGNLAVTTGGVRPFVQANLKINELNLNKYLTAAAGGSKAIETAPTSKAVPAPASAPAPAAQPAPPETGGDPIEDLLNAPGKRSDAVKGTRVLGAAQRAGWSSDAFNFALLGAADADAKLQVARLRYQNINVGQTDLNIALKNRVMKTVFNDIQLYDGRGRGAVNVDGTGKAATVGAAFNLDGVSALPFLTDAADMKWLSGKANLALNLTAAGASQLQVIETLGGTAKFAFADGSIVGFNIPGAIRGISQGKLSGLKAAPTEKTDFSELSATFNIANGVATNQDLLLVSPLLRVTGSGAVQMPPRTIDYTVRPKLVASLEGQQSAQPLSGVEIPVRISGAWEKPKYEPDLKGVLSDPNKVIDAAKDIGKQFKGKNADEIVDGLLGKKPGEPDSGTATKAKDLLNKFLKPKEPVP
jgi:AsmA protein